MIHTVTPHEAAALLRDGGLDVIDVRDPHEWAAGHVPGARLLPLGELKADPRRHLPRDGVLLVCARGARSLAAAGVAEGLGLTSIYSLEGGTQAWAGAGLPVEVAQAAVAAPSAPTVAAAAADEPAAAAEDPALDALVGQNLRALRTQRGVTLDGLARQTGLSRSLLGQIENGKGAPSVGVVWKIARAFDVPFSALLSAPGGVATRVLRRNQARRLVSPDGRFSSRALFPPGPPDRVEFYELHLSGHSREEAEPHQPGTRENLIIAAGRLELLVAGVRYELDEGDAIVFGADVPHTYVNPGSEACRMYLVMTYK